MTTVIDLSIAKRRYSSTCGIHQRMPRPSTVRLAIDPSATRRLWSSTCGILAFTNRIQKPLWDVFSRSFPTSDYDPSLLPATSYANLREHDGWRRGFAESDDAWNRYQDALESELRM